MSELVTIKLYGTLGENVGKTYCLDVGSVGEAIHAINCLTDNKLYNHLLEKRNLQFQVIVNNETVEIPVEQQKEAIHRLSETELNVPRTDLKTIDIVPVIEGGDQGLVASILGGLLIAAGIIILMIPGVGQFASFVAYGLIVAGIGLLAAGVIYMLSEPPKFEDFRSGKRKYLFEGPDNVTGEGGPVPILYGRLIVGSQVIAGYLDSDYSLRSSKNDDYLQVVEYDENGHVVTFYDPDGNLVQTGAMVSPRQRAVVYDLVSEGTIDGPVSKEYKYQGTAGKVGFDSVTEVPYKVNSNLGAEPWLRSVIYNEVPALSMDGNSNYQQLNVSYSPGSPDGQLLGSQTLDDSSNELRITRPLSERLWYNDPNKNANIKVVRLLNIDVKTVRLSWKIPAFYRLTKAGEYEPGAGLTATVYYRPIYNFGGTNYSDISISGPERPDVTDPTSFLTRKVVFNGLISVSPLTWTTVIDLKNIPVQQKYLIGWEIKIERNTEEQLGKAQAPLYLDSLTEVYSEVFSMPNSAVFRNEFLSDYFATIPKRSYDLRGLKIKIPNNYDPITKQYSATILHEDGTYQEWDGRFKRKAWSDNPAWCFFDLLTNRRYGLGRWISEAQVDKWTLYLIGKYCDTMVPDGYGSVEPRFTCNTYIVSREQAYKVLNDFASIFNAIVYYGFGAIQVVQDRLKDPGLLFTNSNVEEGNFTYSSSSRKARHTVAMVRYNDPKNFFRPGTEYVEDVPGIQRYGYREIDLTAYGSTSRGQAVRLGRWALLSESLETETVSFTAGLEGAYMRPGTVFKVYDQNRKIENYQGRTSSINGDRVTITLDKEISLQNKDYRFCLITPSYFYDPNVVSSQSVTFLAPKDASGIHQPQIQSVIFNGSTASTSNNKTTITLSEPLSNVNYSLDANLTWLIESVSPTTNIDDIRSLTDSNYDYYRCIRVEEKDTLKYDIVGLQYNSGKFALIENGLNFERSFFEYGATPANPQAAAINPIHGSSRYKVDYSFVVPSVSGITNFWVYANSIPFTGTGVPDRQYLVDVIGVDQRQGYFYPITTGNYHVRIYSYNADAKILSTSFASGTALLDYPVKPIESVSVSTLMVNSYTGSYGSGVDIIVTDDINPTFTWQLGTAGAPFGLGAVQCRLTFREPTSGVIPGARILKEVTGISPSGRFDYTFDFIQNKNISGGPYRNFSVVVEAYSETADPDYTSAGHVFRPYRDEFGWVTHPWGYTHMLYMNPPISGITLSSGNFVTGNYASTGWIDPNGGVTVKFTSGNLPTGIVLGVLYAHTGYFSGEFARTGGTIPRYEFEFNTSNHITKSFSVPYVFSDFRTKSGYIAVSFGDSYDREYKRFNAGYYSGLDVTNTVPICRFAGVSDLYVTSQAQFEDFNRKENIGIIKITGSGTSYDMVLIDSGNVGAIMFSWTGG